MEKNRSLDTLMNMNAVIHWSKIEKLLLKQTLLKASWIKMAIPLSIIETWNQIGLLKMMSLITVLKYMHPSM